MESVKKLLNIISDFKFEADNKEIVFPGILQEENNGNIILNAKFPMEEYRKIMIKSDLVFLGKVGSKRITLMGCHIARATLSIDNTDASIFAVPKEIISGGYFPSTPMVKRIVVSTSDLNYMFSEVSPLESCWDFSKDDPNVLKCTFPQPIVANDKYGEIQLYQSFGAQWSIDYYKHTIVSKIEYSFTAPLPILDAVAKLFAARSLFSFFGNGYISFEDISFEVDGNKTTYDLWLNHKENIPAVNTPFLIDISAFENQFQEVWQAWLDLYEGASPIPTLFYEIICNHSSRVNAFLNLSQAIEVYSVTFRNKQAKEIAKNDPNNSKRKETKLTHRFQDILTEYNGALELIDADIADYAKGFSNMRNYYTHYNSGKYVEPTFDELIAAMYVLRFLLLTIVYSAVGISIDHILECKNKIFFITFNRDTETILKYSKKIK